MARHSKHEYERMPEPCARIELPKTECVLLTLQIRIAGRNVRAGFRRASGGWTISRRCIVLCGDASFGRLNVSGVGGVGCDRGVIAGLFDLLQLRLDFGARERLL